MKNIKLSYLLMKYEIVVRMIKSTIFFSIFVSIAIYAQEKASYEILSEEECAQIRLNNYFESIKPKLIETYGNKFERSISETESGDNFDTIIAIKNIFSEDAKKIKEGVSHLEAKKEQSALLSEILIHYYVSMPIEQGTSYPNIGKILYWGENALKKSKVKESAYIEILSIAALIRQFDETGAYKDIGLANQYFTELYSLIKNDPKYKPVVENMYLTGYGVEQNFEYVWNNSIKQEIIDDFGNDEYALDLAKNLWKDSIKDDYGKRQLWLGGIYNDAEDARDEITLSSYFESIKSYVIACNK